MLEYRFLFREIIILIFLQIEPEFLSLLSIAAFFLKKMHAWEIEWYEFPILLSKEFYRNADDR